MRSDFASNLSPFLTSRWRVIAPPPGCHVGPTRTPGQSASPVTDSLYLSASEPSDRWIVFQPPIVVGQRTSAISPSPTLAKSVSVGRSATGGFHALRPSLSSFGRERTTSPRSTSARSSILGPWYAGSGGRRTATDAGSGNRPLRGALRLGGATIVLARTASGDVQPSASLAACVAAAIRSGAGVIFSAGFESAVFASVGAGIAACATGAGAAVGAGAA